MATNDRNAFKAGLFIVISLVLILCVIVGIKGLGRLIEPQQVRTATFTLADDIGGLRVGDDVRVGGLKVGIVRSLSIARQTEAGVGQQPHILVTFHIPERIILREGARIGVQNTVTGTSWLNFDHLGAGGPLAENAPLVGSPGTMTQLLRTVQQLAPELKQIAIDIRTVTLPKVNSTADNASGLLADARGDLKPAIERYNAVTTRLTEALTHLRDILGDGKTDIRTTIANLKDTTGTLKETLPPVMNKLDSALAKVNTSLDTAQVALKDLTHTMENARHVSSDVRSILTRNKSRIDELAQSAKEAGDNLKFATAEIRRSPWRLLYKPRPGEVANLNLFDAARDFAEGANDMSDAATALRDALKDPKADPEMIQKLVNELDKSFGNFSTVEDALWKRVRE
ncbi:MAG: phospholipid/cholesterol/gamma-HCH transport system substrate-binding protein [Humisphaera sp.]|nr:phospholipid/cholesterol/gamma-HCH transport system substrate-binding protein [Humisphaera sp.]